MKPTDACTAGMTAIERGSDATLPPQILGDRDQFGKYLGDRPRSFRAARALNTTG
jgi:hypothetical protein